MGEKSQGGEFKRGGRSARMSIGVEAVRATMAERDAAMSGEKAEGHTPDAPRNVTVTQFKGLPEDEPPGAEGSPGTQPDNADSTHLPSHSNHLAIRLGGVLVRIND